MPRLNKTDDLISSFLVGEISAAEKQELMQWVAASKSNAEYFDKKKEIWLSSMTSAEKETFQPEMASLQPQARLRHQTCCTEIAQDTPPCLGSLRSSLSGPAALSQVRTDSIYTSDSQRDIHSGT